MLRWKNKIRKRKNTEEESTNNRFISEFKSFVSENKNKSYSLCYRILRDRSDAEDALQESFLRLYNALKDKKYNGSSKLTTYFYSIVYNTSVEFYRKKKSKSFNIKSFEINDSYYKDGDEFKNVDNYLSNLLINKYDTENVVITNEIKKIINHFLNLIPEHYSTILTMSFINELTTNEISEILNIPVGTVKNRIFRAKEKLKSILLQLFNEEELSEYFIK